METQENERIVRDSLETVFLAFTNPVHNRLLALDALENLRLSGYPESDLLSLTDQFNTRLQEVSGDTRLRIDSDATEPMPANWHTNSEATSGSTYIPASYWALPTTCKGMM